MPAVLLWVCLTVASALAASLLPSASGQAGGQPPASIDLFFKAIEEARPLAGAALELERRLGVPVTYEDLEWSYGGDIMRAAESRGPTNLRPDVLLVRAARIDLRMRLNRDTRRPIDPPDQLFADLLAAYALRGNSGEFRALSVDDGYSIVPVRHRDASGTLVQSAPLLDTRISFPRETRSGRAAIEVICDALRTASGKRIGLGTMSSGPILQGTVPQLVANNEVARDVLFRALRDLRYPNSQERMIRTSWSLYYDPDSKAFFLNLHEMRAYSTAPGGPGEVVVSVYKKE